MNNFYKANKNNKLITNKQKINLKMNFLKQNLIKTKIRRLLIYKKSLNLILRKKVKFDE